MSNTTGKSESPDFQLFEAGSFLGLENVWAPLRLDGLTITRKIVLSVLLTWLPLLILAAVQGLAIGPTRAESFLLDAAGYARYLVALPLLFYSQKKMTIRFRSIVHHFLNAGLVKDSDKEQFMSNIAEIMRLRHKTLVDWLLCSLRMDTGLRSFSWWSQGSPPVGECWAHRDTEDYRWRDGGSLRSASQSLPLFCFVFCFVLDCGGDSSGARLDSICKWMLRIQMEREG